MFFLASYVNYHQITGVSPQLYSVPTSLERMGDFTQLAYPIYDPTTTVCSSPSVCTNKQFMGLKNGVLTPNVIPQNEISPLMQYMQSFLPPATNDNATQNNLLSGIPSGNDNHSIDAKIDCQISPRQRASFLIADGQTQIQSIHYLRRPGTPRSLRWRSGCC